QLTCGNLNNLSELAAQFAPYYSCNPDQASREQQQTARLRGGERSSIADKFLWTVTRASADGRVQRQPFKLARRSVLRHQQSLGVEGQNRTVCGDALAEQVPHRPVAGLGAIRPIHHAQKDDASRFVIHEVVAKQAFAGKQSGDVGAPALTGGNVVVERVTHHGCGFPTIDREIVRIGVVATGDVRTRVQERHFDRGGISRGQRAEKQGYNQRQEKAATEHDGSSKYKFNSITLVLVKLSWRGGRNIQVHPRCQ